MELEEKFLNYSVVLVDRILESSLLPAFEACQLDCALLQLFVFQTA